MEDEEARFEIWRRLALLKDAEFEKFREHIPDENRFVIDALLTEAMSEACRAGVELGFQVCYEEMRTWLLGEHGIELPPREQRFRPDAPGASPEPSP